MGWLRNLFASRGTPPDIPAPDPGPTTEGQAPLSQDTHSAIGELSRVVRNNPDMVEIYLALGNLYRSQGEIERAVHIRNNLIVRPGLNNTFKQRAWYELGRDYRRGGFLDRAKRAFEEARRLDGDKPLIITELARLAADSGDFEVAARHYRTLGHPLAEAHYLVRLAREKFYGGDASQVKKLLKRALDAYPGSVEAWIMLVIRAYKEASASRLTRRLEEAFIQVDPRLRFAILEELMRFIAFDTDSGSTDPLLAIQNRNLVCDASLMNVVLEVLEKQPDDLLLHYYGALILMACSRLDEARVWLERTLMLGQDFWPARLELLAQAIPEQELSPVFESQLKFFIERARMVKRFQCRVCGLKQSVIFFVCPRCQSWHSIVFRMLLKD